MEPDALIFTDSDDKVLAQDRHVAAWSGALAAPSRKGSSSRTSLARSAARLIDQCPFSLFLEEAAHVIRRLRPALEDSGVTTIQMRLRGLYRVEHIPEPVR
jgi:hypothetical protein